MTEFNYKQRALVGRQKERHDMGWVICFSDDPVAVEDAKARLAAMDEEDKAWNEAFKNNPHLKGE